MDLSSMTSVEAELLAVERDFAAGRCGAFEDPDAQKEVSTRLHDLRQLENELFDRSRDVWAWTAEEQSLWSQAMHRPQQQQSQSQSAQPGVSGTPLGGGAGAAPQPQLNGAEQLVALFAKRDFALTRVADTVSAMAARITASGGVLAESDFPAAQAAPPAAPPPPPPAPTGGGGAAQAQRGSSAGGGRAPPRRPPPSPPMSVDPQTGTVRIG